MGRAPFGRAEVCSTAVPRLPADAVHDGRDRGVAAFADKNVSGLCKAPLPSTMAQKQRTPLHYAGRGRIIQAAYAHPYDNKPRACPIQGETRQGQQES